MVANCNRFYKVESGDGCWAIANAANIDVNKFYSMNPAVGTDCSLLLAGFYVCLGLVSDGGPATTITSGTPVAPTIASGTPAAPTTTSGTTVAATPRPVQVRFCVHLRQDLDACVHPGGCHTLSLTPLFLS